MVVHLAEIIISLNLDKGSIDTGLLDTVPNFTYCSGLKAASCLGLCMTLMHETSRTPGLQHDFLYNRIKI